MLEVSTFLSGVLAHLFCEDGADYRADLPVSEDKLARKTRLVLFHVGEHYRTRRVRVFRNRRLLAFPGVETAAKAGTESSNYGHYNRERRGFNHESTISQPIAARKKN